MRKKQPPTLSFDKAAKYLLALQEGKGNKQAAHEAGLSRDRLNLVREKFPLFLGLPKLRKKP